jgi:hypothetical protein
VIVISTALWEELSDSVISVNWNFNETPSTLDSVASSNNNEFESIFDLDGDEWDEECLNLASEGSL